MNTDFVHMASAGNLSYIVYADTGLDSIFVARLQEPA